MRNYKRNVTIVSNEIDYEKLAEAIVKAQSNEKEIKKDTGKLRSSAMSFLNGVMYSTVYIVSGLFIYTVWTELHPKHNVSLVSCVVLTMVLVFVGAYSFLCQQESFQDKKSDIREHFNINISLIALIVAIVAFLKK